MKLTLRELKKIINKTLFNEGFTVPGIDGEYDIPRTDVLEAIDYVIDFLEASGVLKKYENKITKQELTLLLKEISLKESGEYQASDPEKIILHNGKGSSKGTKNVFQMDAGTFASIADVNKNVNMKAGRKLIDNYQKGNLEIDEEDPFDQRNYVLKNKKLLPEDSDIENYNDQFLSPIDTDKITSFGRILSRYDFSRSIEKQDDPWENITDVQVRGDLYLNTLYAALYIILRRYKSAGSGSLDTTLQRAQYWKNVYNTSTGAGSANGYKTKIESHGVDSGSAQAQNLQDEEEIDEEIPEQEEDEVFPGR